MKLIDISKQALLEAVGKEALATGFLTEDLINIVEAQQGEWTTPVSGHQLLEDLNIRGVKQMANDVLFSRCPLFDETYSEKISHYPDVKSKIEDFIIFKSENPMAPFGSKDAAFIGAGPLGKTGVKHAHLTRDLFILYTLSGKSPKIIKLYGVATHHDSGTGTPANPNKQKSLAKKLSRQEFYQPVKPVDILP